MAQAKIVNITNGEEAHPDAMLLGVIGSWKVARAEALLCWAKSDKESLFDTNEKLPKSAGDYIRQVDHAEGYMAAWEPQTTYGASVVLKAVADMLSTKKLDEDNVLGDGPILEMILNVIHLLEKQDVHLKN